MVAAPSEGLVLVGELQGAEFTASPLNGPGARIFQLAGLFLAAMLPALQWSSGPYALWKISLALSDVSNVATFCENIPIRLPSFDAWFRIRAISGEFPVTEGILGNPQVKAHSGLL